MISHLQIKIRYFAKLYHEVMMGIGKNHDVCSVVVDSAKEQGQVSTLFDIACIIQCLLCLLGIDYEN